MKKIASHNSLSYHLPQWYLMPFTFMAKFQSLTIQEQYNAGVHLFDIRVKIVKGRIYSGHGLMTYKVNFNDIFSFLHIKGDCQVHLLLESGNEDTFVWFVNEVKRTFPKITFLGGQRKKDWGKIANLPDFACTDYYWKHEKWYMFPYPKKYAKRHNRENKKWISGDIWSMFNFVELLTYELWNTLRI